MKRAYLLALILVFVPVYLFAGTHSGPSSGGVSSWNDLTDIPAGFADGVDATGGSTPTVASGDPVDGTTLCTTVGELYINSDDESVWRCTNATTETWLRTGIAYIDWNPDATSTTTAGLREALAQCPVTGDCVVVGRPNTQYDMTGFTFSASDKIIADVCDCVDDDNCANSSESTDECSDLWIIGSGGTRVTLGTSGTPWRAADDTEGAVTFKQILQFSNVTRGGVKNIDFTVYDSCNSTADTTCPVDSSEAFVISVSDNADDIEISGNYFNITETNTGSQAGDDDDFNQWYAIESSSTANGLAPRRLRILNNTIFPSAAGIGFAHAGGYTTGPVNVYDAEPDAPLVEGNFIYLSNFSATPRPSKAFAISYSGSARIIGNHISMKEGSAINNDIKQFTAIECVLASPGDEDMLNVHTGGSIMGNIITYIGYPNNAIKLNNCNGVVVSGNSLMAGQCSGDQNKSCMWDEECSPGTCTATAANGIRISTGDIAASIGHSITGNTFSGGPEGGGGWNDTTYYAPLVFDGTAATDTEGGRGNVVSNNAMKLSDTTDDGLSSFDASGTYPLTWVGRNQVEGNSVAGGTDGTVPFDASVVLRAEKTIEFQDASGGDGYSFASETTAPSGTTVFTLNIDPATCTGDGSGGALTVVGAGPYTIECSADDGGGGSGDITAVGPGFASGGAFTDGVVSTGSTMFVWEGTTSDANEFTINAPSSDPVADVTITFPATTGTVVTTGDSATVTSTMITNGTIVEDDLTADFTFDDGDSLNFSGITLSTTGEGLILTQPSDCDALTGLTTGTACYDTTDDSFCVYDGTAMDCQILGAAGSGDITIVGDCTTGDCFEGAGAENDLKSIDDFNIHLDDDNDGTNTFKVLDGADATAFSVTEAGVVTVASGGTITIPGSTTDGQYISLAEDTDIDGDSGTNNHTWTLDVGSTNLASDLVATVQADGGVQFPGALTPTSAADPGDDGQINLANAETICWEASPTGTDVCITATSGEVIDITGGTLNGADLGANTVADAAVVDTITASNYLPLAGGTLTAEVTVDDLGLQFTEGDSLTDCTTFSATGGGIFYDDSEGVFKKCQDNVLTDLDTSAGSPAFTDITAGTNAAALVVGTSGSLAASGTGTIVATGVDAVGAADIQIGSADVTNITLQTDAMTVTDADLAIIADSLISTSEIATNTIGSANVGSVDAEASGVELTIPVKLWFPAAGCNNATASILMDAPTTNAAAAACVTGTNTQKGVADFDDTTDESLQFTVMLPSDFSGNIDVNYKWLAAAITGSVGWCTQLICVADGETDDPAFPAQSTSNCVSDAAKGTTLQTNDAADTSITATGCAAGELMHVQISRDANGGVVTDDMTGDGRLIGVEMTLRRAM